MTLSVAPISGLTVTFSGFFAGAYGHDVGSADVDIHGGSVHFEDDSPTHWRAFTYLALAIGYDVLPWLNLQLGIQNAGTLAPLFDSAGNAAGPVSPRSQVFLTSTFAIDAIVNTIVGGDDGDLTPEERQRRRQGLARRGDSSAF
jgi:hypothetical protein